MWEQLKTENKRHRQRQKNTEAKEEEAKFWKDVPQGLGRGWRADKVTEQQQSEAATYTRAEKTRDMGR